MRILTRKRITRLCLVLLLSLILSAICLSTHGHEHHLDDIARVEQSRSLLKRDDPQFLITTWDWSRPEEVNKVNVLKTALEDTRELVRRVLYHWNDLTVVRESWFGADEKVQQAVKQVYQNILTTSQPWRLRWHWNGPDFSNLIHNAFHFSGTDTHNYCQHPAKPIAFALTYPPDEDEPVDVNNRLKGSYSICHACDSAFVPQDEEWVLKLSRSSDIRGAMFCEKFKTADGAYRYHYKMESLGGILLHEMTHFALVGQVARELTDPDYAKKENAIDQSAIVDYAKSPYLAWQCMDLGGGINCAQNAWSYGWMAAEFYWTVECWSFLQRQPDLPGMCKREFGPPNGESMGPFDYANPANPKAERPPLPEHSIQMHGQNWEGEVE